MEGQVIENAVQETVQETVDKVNSNWDQIKAYFNGHIPDLISFGMKVVLSIVAFYVGTKLIKWLLKVAKSSMEKADIVLLAACVLLYLWGRKHGKKSMDVWAET